MPCFPPADRSTCLRGPAIQMPQSVSPTTTSWRLNAAVEAQNRSQTVSGLGVYKLSGEVLQTNGSNSQDLSSIMLQGSNNRLIVMLKALVCVETTAMQT